MTSSFKIPQTDGVHPPQRLNGGHFQRYHPLPAGAEGGSLEQSGLHPCAPCISALGEELRLKTRIRTRLSGRLQSCRGQWQGFPQIGLLMWTLPQPAPTCGVPQPTSGKTMTPPFWEVSGDRGRGILPDGSEWCGGRSSPEDRSFQGQECGEEASGTWVLSLKGMQKLRYRDETQTPYTRLQARTLGSAPLRFYTQVSILVSLK